MRAGAREDAAVLICRQGSPCRAVRRSTAGAEMEGCGALNSSESGREAAASGERQRVGKMILYNEGGLKQYKCILPRIWGTPKSRCQQGCPPSDRALRENLTLASSSLWGQLAFLTLWLHCSYVVMANFMCHLDWVTECPGICLNIITGCVCVESIV